MNAVTRFLQRDGNPVEDQLDKIDKSLKEHLGEDAGLDRRATVGNSSPISDEGRTTYLYKDNKVSNRIVRYYYDEMLNNNSNTIRLYVNNGLKGGRREFLAKGFLQDNFYVNITNQWNQGDSTILKSIVDSIAGIVTSPTTQRVAELATEMQKFGANSNSPNLQALAKHAEPILGNIRQFSSSHIFSADEFYKTFKGSSVSFPMNFKIQLLSDRINIGIPPEKQYDISHTLGALVNASLGDFGSALFGFVGIQEAPNGYHPSSNNLREGQIIPGTIEIEVGDPNKGGFLIRNMVMTQCQPIASVTKSQIRLKEFRPTSVEVQIMLEPAKKFTKTDIGKVLQVPVTRDGAVNNAVNMINSAAGAIGGAIVGFLNPDGTPVEGTQKLNKDKSSAERLAELNLSEDKKNILRNDFGDDLRSIGYDPNIVSINESFENRKEAVSRLGRDYTEGLTPGTQAYTEAKEMNQGYVAMKYEDIENAEKRVEMNERLRKNIR